MWDEKSNYPRNETGYAFIEDMNNELVEKIKTQTFNQVISILKVNC